MGNPTLVIATTIIVAIILSISVIYFIRSRKTKKIKKILSDLEIEKNKLDSSPVIPELAKVEAYLSNEKVKKMYEDWKERLKSIKEEEIPKLTDMILEAEYSLVQKDYKQTIRKIANLEMEIYKAKDVSDILLNEIKEITYSEEKSRVIITEYKVKYRELFQKFQDNRNDYGSLTTKITEQFDVISKKFIEYEQIMDNKDYTEVNTILKLISDLLKHMKIVMEEVPSILLLSKSVLPKKISEIEETYNQMLKAKYPLDYLNVEYNIEEANKKINDILIKTNDLNLEESLFELKVLLDYFDKLSTDFDKEKIARRKYIELNIDFKNKISKMNEVIDDIFSQLDDLKNVYNLSNDSIVTLNDLSEDLTKLNEDYDSLVSHINQNSFAYSKMLQELEILSTTLTGLDDRLETTIDTLGNMRDDELRAREQLQEIKFILKESKLLMRDYNLPYIPQSYYVELNEASSAIREIVKELERKPITISVLNTRVDTARDLVLKLYSRTQELLSSALLAEVSIVYSNRYRSSFDGFSNKINLAEQLFLKGEYQKSFEVTTNLLSKIEPDIKERIIKMYNMKNGGSYEQ